MNVVGVGSRVINFLADSIFVLMLTYIAYRSWEWYSFYYKVPYFPFFYFWGAVTFLYYLLFEGIWRRTPGKWLSLSKVVDASGKKASFGQIAVRSAVRIVGFILIDSIFLPILGKTLHDYVSKTYVVEV